jgi:hypothetical protein
MVRKPLRPRSKRVPTSGWPVASARVAAGALTSFRPDTGYADPGSYDRAHPPFTDAVGFPGPYPLLASNAHAAAAAA